MHESHIFQVARKLPVKEQDAYLAEACQGDSKLLSDIKELLAVNEQQQDSFPTTHFVSAETKQEPPRLPSITGFQLQRILGQGGMGTVYLAEQIAPVRRQVAIKLIRTEFSHPDILARFHQERQMLALMDHPHIARVLEAGIAEERYPYLVMEYIEGLPITEYCEQNQLSVRQKIELIIQVCQAVQHAHQKGVIHRDLKPGNILVTRIDNTPTVKVIDFGTAKVFASQEIIQSVSTFHGALIGTMEYMSPEQVSLNRDIDTRTDVYSLGVVLYELLTKARPFERASDTPLSYSDFVEQLAKHDIPKPSSRLVQLTRRSTMWPTTNKQPAHAVMGDLDWIVMKCLEKDRDRRYESASQLAQDLHRYLQDEPVLAGPPDWQYKLMKFLRRHRGKVVAACLILVSLLLGMVALSIGLQRALKAEAIAEQLTEEATLARNQAWTERQNAEKSRDDALSQKRSADAVVQFLQQKLLNQGDYKQQVRSLLDTVGSYDTVERDPRISTLLQRAEVELQPENIDKNFSGQPEVQARLLRTLGETYMNIGLADRAIGLLQRVQKLDEQHQLFDESTKLTLQSNLGVAYFRTGQFETALPLFKKVYEAEKTLLGPNHRESLVTGHNLAMAYIEAGNYREAFDLHSIIQEQEKQLYGDNHPHALLTLGQQGYLLHKLGKSKEAIALLQQTAERQKAVLGVEHPDTWITLNNLGLSLLESGKAQEAVPVFREVYQLRLDMLGKNHPRTLTTTENLGMAYHQTGRMKEATELLEYVYQERQKKVQPGQSDDLATINNLAILYRDQGKLNEAMKLFEKSYEGCLRRFGADHSRTFTAQNNLASCLYYLKKYDEAVKLFESVFAARSAKFGNEHPSTLAVRVNLSDALLGMRKSSDAVRHLEVVFPIYRKVHGVDHPMTLGVQSKLGVAYWHNKQLDKSIPCFEGLVKLYSKSRPNDPALIMTKLNLGINYKDAKRYQEAVPCLELALKSSDKQAQHTFALPALIICYLHLDKRDSIQPALEALLGSIAKGARVGQSDLNALESLLREKEMNSFADRVANIKKQKVVTK